MAKSDPKLPQRFHKYLKCANNNNNYLLGTGSDEFLMSGDTWAHRVNGFNKWRQKTDDGNRSESENTAFPKCSMDELHQAADWLRHEIKLMKEEDKLLTQTFLDLNARMRLLRKQLTSLHFSSDISRDQDVAASHLGINACMGEFNLDLKLSPNQEEDYLGEFMERTVSMYDVHVKSSDGTVRTIRKYRTEEYL